MLDTDLELVFRYLAISFGLALKFKNQYTYQQINSLGDWLKQHE